MAENNTKSRRNADPEVGEFIDIALSLSPQGKLHVALAVEDEESSTGVVGKAASERILGAFQLNPASGLLHLASVELSESLPPALAFWRDFGRLFLTQLCALPDLEDNRQNLVLAPPIVELPALVATLPPMRGGEYLTQELLQRFWEELLDLLQQRLNTYKGSVEVFLHTLNPAWNLVGRVCFHLAENKQNAAHPFGFLATYTHRLSAKARAQHLPLGRAIQEYSGVGNRNALLTLLQPVQKAAGASQLIKTLIDSGEIYHPLAWTAEEAYRFLRDVPTIETSGVLVRVPDWWQAKRPPRPEVQVTIGKKGPSGVGLDALMDFNVAMTLEGETLTKAEWQQLLTATSGFVRIKGRWVDLDREKLQEVLDHWQHVQQTVAEDGVSFSEAMRLLSGASGLQGTVGKSSKAPAATEWTRVVAGAWLEKTLTELRSPEKRAEAKFSDDLKATLRLYQKAGVEWLWLLYQLRLGACLADDMGLGKTVQVLAFLLLVKRQKIKQKTLLVVPASLLGNWLAEAEKFAPTLKFFILHPSSLPGGASELELRQKMTAADITMTTYGLLSRFPWMSAIEWDIVILDEAQAIKNPGSKQTLAVKSLAAAHRIVLTGTPVENRLSDLWSLFDFINPGLLGTAKAFSTFVKAQEAKSATPYGAVRNLVRPYILRRLKTDRSIIADLPDKTEVRAYCALSKMQAGLYSEAVADLTNKIEEVSGIQRRGVILSYLTRLKQICNHPSHWLGDGVFEPRDSGKFARLGEICEEIASRQEKALIFTQFREMTGPLARFLESIFGKPGLVLHGETPVKQRKTLVDSFQAEDGPPFFVLSLKAGGTGLNLTAASHVIHFDRWWNPAVENQATDRAFRIGQRRNVLVHKFLCKGTVEEKVDLLIEGKKALASELLEGGGEATLTEMSNSELLKLIALDITTAVDGF